MRADGSAVIRNVVMLLVVLAAVPAAGVEARTREQSDVHERFNQALNVFQSADQFKSIALFSHIIDELNPQEERLAPDLRLLLVRSYCYRAQAALNFLDRDQAAADIRRALTVDPDADIDRTLASPVFVSLFDDTISAIGLGSLRVDVAPPTATVSVDGLKMPVGTVKRLVSGRHVVRAESPGYETASEPVWLSAGEHRTVTLRLKRPAERSAVPPVARPAPALPPPNRPESGGASSSGWFGTPPRRVMVRFDGGWTMTAPAWSSSATFPLYAKTGYADANYLLPEEPGPVGWEVGGWVRVIGPMIVGASRTRSRVDFDTDVVYSVPDSRVGYSARVVDVYTPGIARLVDATNIDIGFTTGGDQFEASIYGGPSRAAITQAVVTNGVFREDLGYVTVSRIQYSDFSLEKQSGWSVGGEVAWLFSTYFGVALSFRYSSYEVLLPDVGTGPYPVEVSGMFFGGGGRIRF